MWWSWHVIFFISWLLTVFSFLSCFFLLLIYYFLHYLPCFLIIILTIISSISSEFKMPSSPSKITFSYFFAWLFLFFIWPLGFFCCLGTSFSTYFSSSNTHSGNSGDSTALFPLLTSAKRGLSHSNFSLMNLQIACCCSLMCCSTEVSPNSTAAGFCLDLKSIAKAPDGDLFSSFVSTSTPASMHNLVIEHGKKRFHWPLCLHNPNYLQISLPTSIFSPVMMESSKMSLSFSTLVV